MPNTKPINGIVRDIIKGAYQSLRGGGPGVRTADNDVAAVFDSLVQDIADDVITLANGKADRDPLTGYVQRDQLPPELAQVTGDYDAATIYRINNIVSTGNALYMALVDGLQGVAPPTDGTSNNNWRRVLYVPGSTTTATFTGEDAVDAVAAQLRAGNGIAINYNDTADTLTLTANLVAGTGIALATDATSKATTISATNAGGSGFATSVRASRAANYGMGTDYFGVVAFEVETTDANAEYDPATGLFLPKANGLYMIDLTAWVQDSAAGDITTWGLFRGGGTTGTLIRYLSINQAQAAGERDTGGVRMFWLEAGGLGYGLRVKNSTAGKNIRGTTNATATSPEPFNLRIARVS